MKNVLNRKFPTLIGLLIITIGIVITTFLVKSETIFQIIAGPGQNPKNIKITNISDITFTVSYTTDDQVIGTINYGIDPNNLDSIMLDKKDQLSQKINKYTAHSITVNNLDPNTTYYYSITSGDKKYLDDGSSYKIRTGENVTENPSSQIPLNGKVILPDGSIPRDGLVYVSIDGAQLISTVLKEDGTYTLPLNNLRNLALNEYFKLNPDTIINIEIYAEKLFSSVSVSPGEINPVPLITLSRSYDFSSPANNPTPSSSIENEGFPTFGNISSSTGSPKFLTPYSGEDFNETQPTFEGIAQPNEIVEITIHSDENINTQVKANAKGSWEYTPEKELSPGEHTITIVTKNKNGVLKTTTKSFTVFAAGSKINQTPTPTLNSSPTETSITTSEINSSPTLLNRSVVIAAAVGFAAAASGIIVFFLTRRKNSS